MSELRDLVDDAEILIGSRRITKEALGADVIHCYAHVDRPAIQRALLEAQQGDNRSVIYVQLQADHAVRFAAIHAVPALLDDDVKQIVGSMAQERVVAAALIAPVSTVHGVPVVTWDGRIMTLCLVEPLTLTATAMQWHDYSLGGERSPLWRRSEGLRDYLDTLLLAGQFAASIKEMTNDNPND